MWGSGLVSSIPCRSNMVVCIPLMFNVRALRLCCEYFVLGGDDGVKGQCLL